MATIPIEIILQDAESPVTPTPESGEETNITVPDTGTISSNGDTSSSVSSIILPAILLVLAIGSIVAILIHKYRKQKKNKTTRKEKLAIATSSTIAILAVTVLIGNLVIPATKAATGDTTDGITPAEDKVSIIVTRDGGAIEASIESTATITSTSDFGYKVLLSMAEGVETSNLYLDGNEESEYYIASAEAENEKGAEFTENTWGYALTEDGEYSAVPLIDTPAIVAQGNEPVEEEEMSIYYGVRISSDLPAGTYSGGEIEYNFVTLEPSNISELTYMQDFAKLSTDAKTSVLRSMTEGEQYTLKDSRDKKDYFISKLKDGNVWMTQNLDLDLSSETALTPANTNITENWKPANSTIAMQGTSAPGWQNSDTVPYSADPGDVYYYTSGSDADDTKYESLEACTGANYTEAECRHYHVGNYYNWTAAIASNESSEYTEDYQNATTSICPAGWRLPVGSSLSGVSSNEIFEMVVGYNGVSEQQEPNGTGGYHYPYLFDGLNIVRNNPIWLTRAGNIYYASLNGGGESTTYWASTVGSNGAYGLYLNSRGANPSDSNRQIGQSARCIVK